VQMFPSRSKPKTEYVTLVAKDWRDAGPEIERLGQRIDAVRGVITALNKRKQRWAVRQWKETEALLFRRWRTAVDLQHCGAKEFAPDNSATTYKIDYDWWEPAEEIISIPIFDSFVQWCNEKFGLTGRPSLNWSWDRAMEQKVQKARQGLA
jgi:hypothetical protein